MEWDGGRFHHTTQNNVQFTIYELLISGIFYLAFLDCSWLQVTETMKSDTTSKKELLYSSNKWDWKMATTFLILIFQLICFLHGFFLLPTFY